MITLKMVDALDKCVSKGKEGKEWPKNMNLRKKVLAFGCFLCSCIKQNAFPHG